MPVHQSIFERFNRMPPSLPGSVKTLTPDAAGSNVQLMTLDLANREIRSR
jgi:hypothetical protein